MLSLSAAATAEESAGEGWVSALGGYSPGFEGRIVSQRWTAAPPKGRLLPQTRKRSFPFDIAQGQDDNHLLM